MNLRPYIARNFVITNKILLMKKSTSKIDFTHKF